MNKRRETELKTELKTGNGYCSVFQRSKCRMKTENLHKQ